MYSLYWAKNKFSPNICADSKRQTSNGPVFVARENDFHLNTETHTHRLMVSVNTLTTVCFTAAPGPYRRCFITVRAGLKTSSVRPHRLFEKSHRHEDTLKETLGTSMGRSLGEREGGERDGGIYCVSVNHFDNIFQAEAFAQEKKQQLYFPLHKCALV